MNPEPTTLDAAQLLRHASFLRSLARSLVGSGPDADDLEQDVWISALGQPAGGRAWLGAVMRNAKRKAVRGRARRAAREEVAASAEALPSSEELVARMEISRRLCDAVLALDEPLRSTIHLHYAEGLSAREIARRSETAVETVRSRIKRGLALLRERLDAELEGGRDAWCVALAPLVSFPSLGSRMAGVGIMSTSKTLVAGMLVVMVSLGGIWAWIESAESPALERTNEPAAPPPAPGREAIAVSSFPRSELPDRTPGTREPESESEPLSPTQPPESQGEIGVSAEEALVALGYTPVTVPNPTGKLTGRIWVELETRRGRTRTVSELLTDLGCDSEPGDQSLSISESGGLANVVITIEARGGHPTETPDPRGIEIRGGRFEPHIVVVQEGGSLQFTNRDIVYAVVQGSPKWDPPFTRTVSSGQACPPIRLRHAQTLEITDDLESGMSLWVVVTDARFAAITDEEGRFEIDGLPPGRHRLRVWHERMGDLKVKAYARIEAGKTVELPVQIDERQAEKALRKR